MKTAQSHVYGVGTQFSRQDTAREGGEDWKELVEILHAQYSVKTSAECTWTYMYIVNCWGSWALIRNPGSGFSFLWLDADIQVPVQLPAQMAGPLNLTPRSSPQPSNEDE